MRLLFGVVAVLLMQTTNAAPAHDDVVSLCTAKDSAAVASATTALESKPEDLEARFALTDALLEASCYDKAVAVLEAGEQYHPRNGDLQKRLRTTRSLQTEQNYFDGLEQAQIAARIQRNQLRCTRLGDVAACDELLRLQPDDTAALIAKADAVLKGDRAAEALSLYRRANDRGADAATIQPKIAAAVERRQALLATCQADGSDALPACRNALQPGASDESDVRKRTGVLLQAANQPADALNEFIAAQALKRDDKSVALAIVALTSSTQRKDAAALTALGSAQLTLGNSSAAIEPLRRAEAIAPGVPNIRQHLATAEQLAKSQPTRAAVTPNPAPLQIQAPTRLYSNVEPASRAH